VHWINNHLRLGYRRGIQRRSYPSYVQWQSRKIDDAPTATIATQGVRRSHENTVYGARLVAQATEHTFRVVARKFCDPEPLTILNLLLADVDAVLRARVRASLAGSASGQIETRETSVACGNWDGFLGVFLLLGERSAITSVGTYPVPQGYEQLPRNRPHGDAEISKPILHGVTT
jgi:hypothetical protein